MLFGRCFYPFAANTYTTFNEIFNRIASREQVEASITIRIKASLIWPQE